MSKITRETRRASYEAVLPKINGRNRLILDTLGNRQMTVSEITDELVAAGKIPHFNRNYVAPRLTGLKDKGLVEPCGRRKATHSTATEAVWRRIEPKEEDLKAMEKLKVCKKCGAEFTAEHNAQKYCPECRRRAAAKRGAKKQSLSSLNEAARAAGMSYGQYVASMQPSIRKKEATT